MQPLRMLRMLSMAAAIALVASTAARAGDNMDDDDGMVPGDDICAGLSEGAQGLCNAYCNAQDCPSHPSKNSCVMLRRNFERQTGTSIFPCDGIVIPTATFSPTRTATALPPTLTPTNTPAATGTATATRTGATPSATAEATQTATVGLTATSTSAPTETATGAATATATKTGVPEATATDTSVPEATATGTATPTGIPTGTAAGALSCADVDPDAKFTCETFCETEHCPTSPHPFCEELRGIFASWTGSSVFPCEAAGAAGACMGDCGGDGAVDISDLTQCLLIVLGERDASQCAGARHDGGAMSIGDMVVAVRHALEGCD